MRRYMLDTDISSYIMKRSNQVVLRRRQKHAVDDICSVISTRNSGLGSNCLLGESMTERL
jgi:hypothetical protein